MDVALTIAESADVVWLRFDSSADDLANYDAATHDFIPANRRDSFIALTGYRHRYLPFEFVRRLAWLWGRREGVFCGCIVHLTAEGEAPHGYDATNLVSRVPAPGTTDRSWVRLPKDDATVFFPRSIDDMVPLIDEERHDALVYLGSSRDEGAIGRLEEDDEWFVLDQGGRHRKSIMTLAQAMGLPVRRGDPAEVAGARAFAMKMPDLVVEDGQIALVRSG